MARLRKLGKGAKYFAYFYDRSRTPKEKSFPLGTSLKSAAVLKLHELERRYADPHDSFDPWLAESEARSLTVREAEEEFLASRTHLRPRTQETYAGVLRRLRVRLPVNLMLHDLSARQLNRFINDMTVLEATRCKRYRHVRVFLRWAEKAGLIEKNPLADVRKPKEGQRVPEFLTPTQLERLLAAIGADYELKRRAKQALPGQITWLADVVRVAVATGMRLGEVISMRWGWVDFETGFITIRNHGDFRTKSGDERPIPMVGDALDVLQRFSAERTDDLDGPVLTGVGGGRLNPNYVSRRFKYYVRLAKLPEHIRFHSLRHTCASWLVQRGVSLPIVQAILGHSTIRVTQRYAHLAPDVMKAAMEQAFGAVR